MIPDRADAIAVVVGDAIDAIDAMGADHWRTFAPVLVALGANPDEVDAARCAFAAELIACRVATLAELPAWLWRHFPPDRIH